MCAFLFVNISTQPSCLCSFLLLCIFEIRLTVPNCCYCGDLLAVSHLVFTAIVTL